MFGLKNITRRKEKELLNYVLQQNNVVFLNKTFGSWDFEMDIIVKDVIELHKFMREIKTKFGHLLGKHYVISIIEERMLNPLREYL